jgi:hypothetical protein
VSGTALDTWQVAPVIVGKQATPPLFNTGDDTMSDKVYIFSCGTQYADWVGSNCERCTKYDANDLPTCEIDEAIGMAYMDDGKVTEEIAIRAGYTEENHLRYVWPCSEVEWIEESEYAAKKAAQ